MSNVMHIDRSGYPHHVWCGRRKDQVTRMELGAGDKPTREDHCSACIRCKMLAEGLAPREVNTVVQERDRSARKGVEVEMRVGTLPAAEELALVRAKLADVSEERDRLAARVSDLEIAVLEATRHLFGKCACSKKATGPYCEVACATRAEAALAHLIETGPPPEYEHRLVEYGDDHAKKNT